MTRFAPDKESTFRNIMWPIASIIGIAEIGAWTVASLFPGPHDAVIGAAFGALAVPVAATPAIIKWVVRPLIEKNSALWASANTDPLTGIHNRLHFDEFLKGEFLRTRRHRHTLSVILLDIDYFKKVNDTYGHPVGDKVLTVVAKVVQHQLRGYDVFARYGGEEFVIALPETPVAAAIQVAERCREAVEQVRFPYMRHGITASFGVASWPTPDIDEPKELLAAADRELYRAKAEGRNRVCSNDSIVNTLSIDTIHSV